MKKKKELIEEMINDMQKYILSIEINERSMKKRLKRDPGLTDVFQKSIIEWRQDKEARIDQLESLQEMLQEYE